MARHATTRASKRPSRTWLVAGLLLVALVGGVGALIALEGSASSPHSRGASASGRQAAGSVQKSQGTTSIPTTSTSTTSSTLPPPGPGFVVGRVTAVGDSVMLDYQDPLKTDVPGINVDASVSRQWAAGESILQNLKASSQLGAEVVVGLGTNGPITGADVDSMMAILGGASRVVFVNVHVDRPWQDPNNVVLAQSTAQYHNVAVADWATLAAQNPQWFGSDGTHLAIDGPGATALASLVSTTLTKG